MLSAHLNDIGTVIRVTIVDQDGVALNVAAATALKILIKKPEGTVLNKTALLYTDGTDGIIKYTVIAGDLDEVGIYSIQGHVTLPSGDWRSSVAKLNVERNLD